MTIPLPSTISISIPPGGGREYFLAKITAMIEGAFKQPAEPSAPPNGLRTPAEAARRPRKPNIRTLVRRVEQATGKTVTAITTTTDGYKLDVTTEPIEPDNPWPLDEFRNKETKQ